MQVDPGELRALAGTMNDIGVGIDAIRTQLDTSAIGSALAGSILAQAGIDANSVATDAWSRMAARWTGVATLVEASASALDVSDVGFADRINTLGGVG